MLSSRNSIALAFDIGGTSIKSALITKDGKLLSVQRIATAAQESPSVVIQQLRDLHYELKKSSGIDLKDVDGIGLCMQGFVTEEGVHGGCAHHGPGWVGYDWKAALMEVFPTENYYFANDNPATALGEAYYGAGRDVANFVYITVSSGMGGAAIGNGKLLPNEFGAGGMSHIVIDEASDRICEVCGNAGCVETFVSKQGILTTTQELLREKPDSLIVKMIDQDSVELSPKLVFEAAQKGDEAACEVFKRAGHALGIFLTIIVQCLVPRRIVIGGGIAQSGEMLFGPAREVVHKRVFPAKFRNEIEIVGAELGDLSGVYGSAVMVFQDVRIQPLFSPLNSKR